MKQKRITQKQLAKHLGCVPSAICHLLKSTDWQISELLMVGERLNENLLSYYLPPADNAPLTELQNRLNEAMQNLATKEATIQQQEMEIKLLNARLEAMRESMQLLSGNKG